MTDINLDFLNQLYTQSGANDLLEVMRAAPTPYRPIVTQQDAENGYITRYFVRVVTDMTYVVEVNVDDYSRLRENPRFITTQLQWKIVGKKATTVASSGAKNLGVRDYNLLEVTRADLTFGGLRRYITDYLAFWLYDGAGGREDSEPEPLSKPR